MSPTAFLGCRARFLPEARDSGQFSVNFPGIDLAKSLQGVRYSKTRLLGQEGSRTVCEATRAARIVCLEGAIVNYRKSMS